MPYRTFKVMRGLFQLDMTAPLLQRSPASLAPGADSQGVGLLRRTRVLGERTWKLSVSHIPGQKRALALSGSCQPASTPTA